MPIDSIDFQERIFDLVNGNLNLEEHPAAESEFVKNEFTDGSYCDLAYEQVMVAYSRLRRRLRTEGEEDGDVEIIINNLLAIGKHLSLKMFGYGLFFARQNDQ